MEIRRLGPIGAEIVGVDVKTMDGAAFGKIYQAWLDCNVIAVRDQELVISWHTAGASEPSLRTRRRTRAIPIIRRSRSSA